MAYWSKTLLRPSKVECLFKLMVNKFIQQSGFQLSNCFVRDTQPQWPTTITIRPPTVFVYRLRQFYVSSYISWSGFPVLHNLQFVHPVNVLLCCSYFHTQMISVILYGSNKWVFGPEMGQNRTMIRLSLVPWLKTHQQKTPEFFSWIIRPRIVFNRRHFVYRQP